MTTPFDPDGRLVVVRTILVSPEGGSEFRLAIDTAATRSSVSGLVLERLGYREPEGSARRQVRTGSGGTRAGLVRVGRVVALGQSQVEFPVLWMPHPPGGMIDGLLGLDFFRGQVLTLDFARGRVSLGPPRRWWHLWR
jgi:hypothetical protein